MAFSKKPGALETKQAKASLPDLKIPQTEVDGIMNTGAKEVESVLKPARHAHHFEGLVRVFSRLPMRYLMGGIRSLIEESIDNSDEYGEDDEVVDFFAIQEELLDKRFPGKARQVMERPEFQDEIYPLLLLLEMHKGQIPGLIYKIEKAIRSEINGEDFVGMEVYPKATVIRLDVKQSSDMRQEGAELAIRRVNQLFEASRHVMPRYPEVAMLETGGDELVLGILNPEEKEGMEAVARDFILDIRREIELLGNDKEEAIWVHSGWATGELRLQIVPHGQLITTGRAYLDAGESQKDEKKGRRLPDYPGKNAIRFESHPSAIQFNSLDPSHPDFNNRFCHVLAHVFSTTSRHFLRHAPKDYGNGTAIMISMECPDPNGDAETEAAWWEQYTDIINSIAWEKDITANYFSADGAALLFAGVLGSKPMDQQRRALECAAELRSAFQAADIQSHAIGITHGSLHFGSLSSALTGAGSEIDKAARFGQVSNDSNGLSTNPINSIINQDDYKAWKKGRSAAPILVAETIATELRTKGFEIQDSLEVKANLKGLKGVSTFYACTGVETSSLESPMIGRENEKNLALNLLASSQASRRPVHLQLIGEPGIGKSRLSEEVLVEARKQHFVIHDKMRHSHQAYGLVLDILQDAFEVTNGDQLSEDEGFQEWLAQNFRPNLAADLKELARSLQDPSAKKSEDGLVQLITHVAQERPLCIVIPHPKRVDPYSIRVLNELFESEERVAVFLMTEARPQEDKLWPNKIPSTVDVSLSEISAKEIAELARSILEPEGTPLSPRILDFILRTLSGTDEKAKYGNPFVVREICFAILEAGSLDFKMDLKNVADYVRTKRDELPDEHRKVLGVACLLGEGLPSMLIAPVSQRLGIPASTVRAALTSIHNSELADLGAKKIHFPRGFFPGEIAKIQVNPAKEDIHRAIADELSSHGSLGILRAYHLCQAGEIKLAIDEALDSNAAHTDIANAERAYTAILKATRGEELDPSQHQNLPWNRIVDLIVERAQAQTRLGHDPDEIEKNLVNASQILKAIGGNPNQERKILKQRCENFYWGGRYVALAETIKSLRALSPDTLEIHMYEVYMAYREAGSKGNPEDKIQKYSKLSDRIDRLEIVAESEENMKMSLELRRLHGQVLAYIATNRKRSGEGKRAREEADFAVKEMLESLEHFQAPEFEAEAPSPSRICSFLRVLTQLEAEVQGNLESAKAHSKTAIQIAKKCHSRLDEILSLRDQGAILQQQVIQMIQNFDPEDETQRAKIERRIEEGLTQLGALITLTEYVKAGNTPVIADITSAELLLHKASIERSPEHTNYNLQQALTHLKKAESINKSERASAKIESLREKILSDLS